ncbi:hypothetical protein O6H91_06G072600 [Diphasiastrum complanatum]|uniref:Uncharacterized protein n=1 Tax=Diphasiastrum complanatum TaxID=34168 RepID=A0ACC2DFF0_DIPCM|nr:hypothetical protein O6H91_06G072600 [Diphasiastrum complanatum]
MGSLPLITAVAAVLLVDMAALVMGLHVDLEFELNPQQRCRSVDLQPCYRTLERDEHPSNECCRRLEQIGDDECRCEALIRDRQLGDDKYRSIAMQLPERCGLSPPRGRECERRHSIVAEDAFFHVGADEQPDQEAAALNPGSQCERVTLQPCYEAVEQQRQPSEECCNKLERIPRECLYEALEQEQRLRQHRQQALRLPQQCGISSRMARKYGLRMNVK